MHAVGVKSLGLIPKVGVMVQAIYIRSHQRSLGPIDAAGAIVG
jgi:hypothetical protein